MATRTSDPEIPMREYEQRRTKLMRAIGKSVGLVFAGTHDDHLNDTFRPHPHFEYLTGVTTEPGAILMIDPSHPHEARRAILYLRPLNPELEQWDGLRSPISAALRDACGVRTIYRTAALGRFLNEAVQRSQRLVCLHPLAQYNQPISPDLKIFRDVMERVPGV
ncbi:MAG: aminopeptidase P N-terminal domain-containing protein, partial [Planctomycetota bacterium]